ncbi:carboxypeptidase-like regulatory domain-containing protein [Acidicapsa ligni]|uniref:carboxypeptidase-like regulatory domain-containing protein n=1 Tax=Acidicapsa ligni TaxID=542300 RepID=UPI0021E0804D|nr:carboxypeptidase-like regulatory domain-containing protein [Acidicapsa ligni]
MKRTIQQFVSTQFFIACFALAALGSLPSPTVASAAVPIGGRGSVAGVVSDSTGAPQIGVAVELLRADSSLVARVFTDSKGHYSIATVRPGQYALKALSASFIPSIKQNLRIRTNTVVNLTLNSLYDLMQWAPQPQRPRPQGEDDWAWTLRSAQGRPLLRWLDDGSPIMVWDGSNETAETQPGSQSKRKLRVQATAGQHQFGASPEQVSVAMQEDTSERHRVAMSTEVSPEVAGLMEAMLGFRQELTNTGLGSSSMQTLAAVLVDPEAGAGSQQGLQTAAFRTWESLQMLNTLEAEAGSDQVLARVGGGSTVVAALPFASLTMHRGASALQYRVATSRAMNAMNQDASEVSPRTWLPVLSERNGSLVLEHGLHQELGWSTTAGPASMQFVIYGDSIENPMLQGSGHLTSGDNAGQWVLVDGASNMLRTAGPNYSTKGLMASVESRLPGHNKVRLSYASGDALVMHANLNPEDLGTIVQSAHSHRAQMYSISLSGTVQETKTHWRASYRRQPESTVTAVAPFAVDASEPYLNVYVRQPVWTNRQGPGGFDFVLDLENLLAEGYQPFLTSDGSQIYFAQAPRCVRGGLAFTF